MAGETKEPQPTLDKDSLAYSQSGDDANSFISNYDKHNAINGSMVNFFIATEDGQCSPGGREHRQEMVYLGDPGTDKQNFTVENVEEEERNRNGSTFTIGLRRRACIACSLLSGTLLLSLGIALTVHYLDTTWSN